MPIDTTKKGFMELLQIHEREWGTEMYPNRPSLADLLNAPIVAVWTGEPVQPSAANMRTKPRHLLDHQTSQRFMLSVHRRLEELDPLILAMIVASKPSSIHHRKLLYLFVQKKPVKILGVRLLLEPIS
jgi:hypothetical protein